MKQAIRRAGAQVLLASLLGAMAGCSPSLNWREVRLGRLQTLLPCKPDSAKRNVVLDGQTVAMEVLGCEAEGALFAISRVQAADAAQAPALLAALRQASLDNVRMGVAQPMPNSGDASNSFDLLVHGQRADGSPLQARLKWLQADVEVFQVAAFAGRLTAEQSGNLVDEVRLH